MGRLGLVAVAALVAALLLAATAVAAPPVPRPDARAFLVEDVSSGQLLAAGNAEARMPIASITKLMTVIIALHHLRLDQIVSVDPRAAAVGQESIYLVAGERISVYELLEGALIQSANDAADALALAVAPSFPAFARLMNAEARRLGLDDTHFVRPDGLDAAGEYSSARDVTRLALVAMRVPIVRALVDKTTATIAGGEVLHTWNDLLGVFPGVFGVKTGNTSAAGWCQVVAARGEGTTIYVTILGSPTRDGRDDDLEALLAWALDQYRAVEPVLAGHAYAQVRLPDGRAPLALVAAAPLAVSARMGMVLSERIVAPLSHALPVRRGAALGRIEVFEGGRLLGERPLLAARSVAAPGLPGRIGWYLRRSVHDLLGVFT